MLGAILSAIVIGVVIGALARLVVPGRQSISTLWTVAVGIIGAFIGTVLAAAVGVADTPGVDWIELILQVVIAAVGVSVVSGRTSRRR